MPRRYSSQLYTGVIEEAVELYPYPEMSEYTVILQDGQKIKKSIGSLDWLLQYLYSYGSYAVRKLIIRFIHPQYHRYYYPYYHHNITLELTNEQYFHIQFYHYYTVINERVDIPLQQQYYDYCALEQLMFQHPILYDSLYGRLLRPSFLWYQQPPIPVSYDSYEQCSDTHADSISYNTVLSSISH